MEGKRRVLRWWPPSVAFCTAAFSVAMNFGATTAMVEQRLQSLARVKTSLAASDLMLGSGSCAQGQACRKDVVSARAVVKGSPREGDDCGVTVGSAGDGHGVADVDGATLGIMHACEDEDGLVLPQGTGPCEYSVCAAFEWLVNGTLNYEVTISHSMGTGASRTVNLDVYLNYEYLEGAKYSGSSTQCSRGASCPDSTNCGGNATEVEVAAFDSYGDGWIDPFGNATAYWELTGKTAQWTGTLLEGHESSRTRVCLPPGKYDFAAPGALAWSDDVSWTVCDSTGFAGEAINITVADGACSTPVDVVAVSPAAMNTPERGDDATCDLCTELSVEVEDLIGVYSEPECGPTRDTRNASIVTNGGRPGCGVGEYFEDADTTCRFCIVDRQLWAEENPGARIPKWPDCPCCVADFLGIACSTTDTVSTGGDDFVESLSKGHTLELFLVCAVGLAICILCGCAWRITWERQQKKKHAKVAQQLSGKTLVTEPTRSPPPTAGSRRIASWRMANRSSRNVSAHDLVAGPKRNNSGLRSKDIADDYPSPSSASGAFGFTQEVTASAVDDNESFTMAEESNPIFNPLRRARMALPRREGSDDKREQFKHHERLDVEKGYGKQGMEPSLSPYSSRLLDDVTRVDKVEPAASDIPRRLHAAKRGSQPKLSIGGREDEKRANRERRERGGGAGGQYVKAAAAAASSLRGNRDEQKQDTIASGPHSTDYLQSTDYLRGEDRDGDASSDASFSSFSGSDGQQKPSSRPSSINMKKQKDFAKKVRDAAAAAAIQAAAASGAVGTVSSTPSGHGIAFGGQGTLSGSHGTPMCEHPDVSKVVDNGGGFQSRSPSKRHKRSSSKSKSKNDGVSGGSRGEHRAGGDAGVDDGEAGRASPANSGPGGRGSDVTTVAVTAATNHMRPPLLRRGSGGSPNKNDDTSAAVTTASNTSRMSPALRRIRSFGGDSKFKSRTRSFESPFRPGRETLRAAGNAIMRGSPRAQVGPRRSIVDEQDCGGSSCDRGRSRSRSNSRSGRKKAGSSSSSKNGGVLGVRLSGSGSTVRSTSLGRKPEDTRASEDRRRSRSRSKSSESQSKAESGTESRAGSRAGSAPTASPSSSGGGGLADDIDDGTHTAGIEDSPSPSLTQQLHHEARGGEEKARDGRADRRRRRRKDKTVEDPFETDFEGAKPFEVITAVAAASPSFETPPLITDASARSFESAGAASAGSAAGSVAESPGSGVSVGAESNVTASSNDGSIVVGRVQASAKVPRPSMRLRDALVGNLSASSVGKMKRGSSGRMQSAIPVVDFRRESQSNRNEPIVALQSVTAGEDTSAIGRDGVETIRKDVFDTAAGSVCAFGSVVDGPVDDKVASSRQSSAVPRERGSDGGFGGYRGVINGDGINGGGGGGIQVKSAAKDAASNADRVISPDEKSHRPRGGVLAAAYLSDRKGSNSSHSRRSSRSRSGSSGSSQDGGGNRDEIRSHRLERRRRDASTSVVSSRDERRSVNGSESMATTAKQTPTAVRSGKTKDENEGGGHDNVCSDPSAVDTGISCPSSALTDQSEESSHPIQQPDDCTNSSSPVAKRGRSPRTMSQDRRREGRSASRSRSRSRSISDVAREESMAAGNRGTSGDDEAPNARDTSSVPPRQRREGHREEKGTNSGSITGGPGRKSRRDRGSGEFRQSSRSRLREMAYQAARSRSRGSCNSLSSLQRVEEGSDESASSCSSRRRASRTPSRHHRGQDSPSRSSTVVVVKVEAGAASRTRDVQVRERPHNNDGDRSSDIANAPFGSLTTLTSEGLRRRDVEQQKQEAGRIEGGARAHLSASYDQFVANKSSSWAHVPVSRLGLPRNTAEGSRRDDDEESAASSMQDSLADSPRMSEDACRAAEAALSVSPRFLWGGAGGGTSSDAAGSWARQEAGEGRFDGNGNDAVQSLDNARVGAERSHSRSNGEVGSGRSRKSSGDVHARRHRTHTQGRTRKRQSDVDRLGAERDSSGVGASAVEVTRGLDASHDRNNRQAYYHHTQNAEYDPSSSAIDEAGSTRSRSSSNAGSAYSARSSLFSTESAFRSARGTRGIPGTPSNRKQARVRRGMVLAAEKAQDGKKTKEGRGLGDGSDTVFAFTSASVSSGVDGRNEYASCGAGSSRAPFAAPSAEVAGSTCSEMFASTNGSSERSSERGGGRSLSSTDMTTARKAKYASGRSSGGSDVYDKNMGGNSLSAARGHILAGRSRSRPLSMTDGSSVHSSDTRSWATSDTFSERSRSDFRRDRRSSMNSGRDSASWRSRRDIGGVGVEYHRHRRSRVGSRHDSAAGSISGLSSSGGGGDTSLMQRTANRPVYSSSSRSRERSRDRPRSEVRDMSRSSRGRVRDDSRRGSRTDRLDGHRNDVRQDSHGGAFDGREKVVVVEVRVQSLSPPQSRGEPTGELPSSAASSSSKCSPVGILRRDERKLELFHEEDEQIQVQETQLEEQHQQRQRQQRRRRRRQRRQEQANADEQLRQDKEQQKQKQWQWESREEPQTQESLQHRKEEEDEEEHRRQRRQRRRQQQQQQQQQMHVEHQKKAMRQQRETEDNEGQERQQRRHKRARPQPLTMAHSIKQPTTPSADATENFVDSRQEFSRTRRRSAPNTVERVRSRHQLGDQPAKERARSVGRGRGRTQKDVESDSTAGKLARADAWGVYGFLKPTMDIRSRSSVEDPKVLDLNSQTSTVSSHGVKAPHYRRVSRSSNSN